MDIILGIILIFAACVAVLLLALVPLALVAWLLNTIVMFFSIFEKDAAEPEAK